MPEIVIDVDDRNPSALSLRRKAAIRLAIGNACLNSCLPSWKIHSVDHVCKRAQLGNWRTAPLGSCGFSKSFRLAELTFPKRPGVPIRHTYSLASRPPVHVSRGLSHSEHSES